jgi:hypothetical protein
MTSSRASGLNAGEAGVQMTREVFHVRIKIFMLLHLKHDSPGSVIRDGIRLPHDMQQYCPGINRFDSEMIFALSCSPRNEDVQPPYALSL